MQEALATMVTQNVISCGSYTGNGSATGPVIDLGYEPQWVLIKGRTDNYKTRGICYDNMRGLDYRSLIQVMLACSRLIPAAAEVNVAPPDAYVMFNSLLDSQIETGAC
jgi:hypothetical protein